MKSLLDLLARIPVAGRLAMVIGDVARGLSRLARLFLTRVPFKRRRVARRAIRSGGLRFGTYFGLNAAVDPGEIAVVDGAGHTTFAELNTRVNRLANVLRQEGCESGGRLAFMLPNCREALEAIGAAAKLGMVPVPVNTRFQTEEVAFLLKRQRADAVIVDSGLGERVAGFGGAVIVRGEDYEARLRSADALEPARSPGSGSSRLVIHTSGTTGRPKGAERKLSGFSVGAVFGFFARIPVEPGDTIVVPAPMFHSLGFGAALLGACVGATLVLQERFDATEFCRLVTEERATGAFVVPLMLKRVVEADAAVLDRLDASSMRWILCSGSALSTTLESQVRDIFGPVLRDLYGSTEAGHVAIATPDDKVRHPSSVGRPLPGVRIRIVADDGRSVAVGEIGEIVVDTRNVFSGYTDEAAGPARPRGGYRLGDLGRFDDLGYLYVTDRTDDMVVTGGENVYPAEVERVLEGVPGVRDVAALGVDDDQYGQILVAFVTAEPGVTLAPADLVGLCRARIANFKTPKHIWVVDELPYNATGKVLRRVLREEAAGRLAEATA